MVLKKLCVLVLWMKVASSLNGLTHTWLALLDSVVCYYDAFKKNVRMKQKLAKYFKGSCVLGSE